MSNLYKTICLVPGLSLALMARLCAGPPFLTDDPDPVDFQHWEAYLFTSGILPTAAMPCKARRWSSTMARCPRPSCI